MKRKKTPAGRPESARHRTRPELDSDAEPELAELDGLDHDSEEGIRLNKFLAQNGVASRRGADELIAKGKVMVDGKVVTELGTRIHPETSRVEVDGEVLRAEGETPRYYLLNKPTGVVCTNDPRESRPRAIDLVNDRKRGRIFTVGRLDEDTEGLVILTNDGEFAQRVSHPRYGIRKSYRVDVRGLVDDGQLDGMRAGVRLSDGWAGFERVRVIKRSTERSILLVELGEGKNREVRRVLAALGLPVRSLRRVSIGALSDRKLKTGQWRFLTKAEVGMLLEPPAEGEDGLRPARPRFDERVSSKRPWKQGVGRKGAGRSFKKPGQKPGGAATGKGRKPAGKIGQGRRSGPGVRSRGRQVGRRPS